MLERSELLFLNEPAFDLRLLYLGLLSIDLTSISQVSPNRLFGIQGVMRIETGLVTPFSDFFKLK